MQITKSYIREKDADRLTLSERFADWVTEAIASDLSLIGHTVFFVALLLSPFTKIWDVGTMLLVFTTIVSIEAIYIGLFLQRSSNAHGERDRRKAELDLQIDMASRHEIENVSRALTRVELEHIKGLSDKLDTLIRRSAPEN